MSFIDRNIREYITNRCGSNCFHFFYRTIGFKDIEKKKDVQSMSGEKIISYISSHPLFSFEEIYKELLSERKEKKVTDRFKSDEPNYIRFISSFAHFSSLRATLLVI